MNRYAYVRNNPLRFVDPTGMYTEEEIMDNFGVEAWDEVLAIFDKGGQLEDQWGWLEVLRRAENGDSVSATLNPSAKEHQAFSGKFGIDKGSIMLGLQGGQQLSAMDAGRLAGKRGVEGYEIVQNRGAIAWMGYVRATQRHDYVRDFDAAEFGWGGIEVLEMWSAAASLAATGGMFLTGAFAACEIGGPSGCVAGGMMALTAVPAAFASAFFVKEGAAAYTHYWWSKSVRIAP